MLENELKRIADALEALVAQRSPQPKAPAAEQPKAPAPVTPPPAAPAAPVTPPPAAPAAPAAPGLTKAQLNEALLAEMTRLGKREPIVAVLAQFGATNIPDLKESDYQAVLDAVRLVAA